MYKEQAMKILQYCWIENGTWDRTPQGGDLEEASLILVFGATTVVTNSPCITDLRQAFPEASMLGCTTGGEIVGTTVSDDRLIATVISFRSSWDWHLLPPGPFPWLQAHPLRMEGARHRGSCSQSSPV